MSQTLNTLPVATSRTTATLREFGSYEEAQQLVDRLSDAGFPVDLRIVGTGLRTVEQVTGRLTKGRAARAERSRELGSAC
jgi:Heat induced stress protein YflT domain